ncbi:MAG: AraC family transcriptional regulator [Terricaulis sp.]
MDGSKLDRRTKAASSFTGVVIERQRFAGAVVSSILHPPGQRIEPHQHDWPVLTLYGMGSYVECCEDRCINLDGPSVVFHPPGAAHADVVGDTGLETLAISFDPAWLSPGSPSVLPRKSRWVEGGAIAAAGVALAQTAVRGLQEQALRAALLGLLATAFSAEAEAPAGVTLAWLRQVKAAVEDEGAGTNALALRLARHPAWVARSYRRWRGEGIAETLRRRRVERSVVLLRETAMPLAELAAACGFCDQSHMNRSFRAVLGRTPAQVRAEAGLLAHLA